MIATQYEITLPADYDMTTIRDRVRRTGHLLDDYPGLGLKAFLIRELGTDGSPVNQYAPFYLWADAGGAASFLWSGEGFTAIMRDFGRPTVRTWVGGSFQQGPAYLEQPGFAARTTLTLGPDADLVAEAARAEATVTAEAGRPGVHSSAYAVDPSTWQLVAFTLHVDRPIDAQGVIYQVLHVAAPERDQLPSRAERRLRPSG